MRDKKLLGALGEELASSMLFSEGHRILDRNFRSYMGEVDIITEKDDTVFFVEVKTRTASKFGDPLYAVDEKKKSRIKKTAEYYMMRNHLKKNISFKVVEVLVRVTDDDFMF